ncbi:helix-hairpin-helix domain-containing protein [Staphylococcus pettenkoferi]|uniref:Helix-hairpin-helix domain-containing protein n=1 Tax=Staphylococcus pettenkoferi TaxID=170573 RepID=A0ABT4BIN5_9STAP|nr:helix-hairpin-helix domain-containing protein [Staphylococcus pettenkoferi]MCY1564747.1 helix-hairpin-helix domain-containing protein [Staphylococcus pettenkoferi]MCY1572016.1 helix-hairpin-helix domain-containing protein [Staphylococcus pettenkoferi]MCY1582533.1 helix-hairpin-helix domain-containing protein [Staphylococcus pettenkoferi]MCY1589952.1 helix-hairpin-helix domain-containing protein [Staphylococcus pettenkoferi]MCY1599733.1 helix-hairpin-helix domain-containing protein [Staphylo
MSWDLTHLKALVMKYKIYVIIACVALCALGFYFVSHIGQSNDLKAEDATLQEQAFKTTDAQGRNNGTTNGASSSGASNTSNTKVEEIYVDIKGAVKHPNIYRMMSTDRLKQLLDKAQPTSQADLTQINLAERLTDQKLIVIPKKGEQVAGTSGASPGTTASTSTTTGSASSNSSVDKQVNINTATESELQSIPGIGPSKAKSIIEYRDTNGAFDSVEKIKEVNGIGEKTFDKLKDYLTV